VLQTTERIPQLIASIAEQYQKHRQEHDDRVFAVAEQLQQTAQEAMATYAGRMQTQFQQSGLPMEVKVTASDPQTMYWYQGDVVKTAIKLRYWANLMRPRLWVRLRVNDLTRIAASGAEIVISFHYLGKETRGVMIASAFLNILHNGSAAVEDEEERVNGDNFRETYTIVTEGFTLTYADASRSEEKQREFRPWLEQAIAVGLAEWRKQL
jgi:hypothetical protein